MSARKRAPEPGAYPVRVTLVLVLKRVLAPYPLCARYDRYRRAQPEKRSPRYL